MFRVDITNEAKAEIRELFAKEEAQARRILAVLENISKSETNIEDLTERGYFCEDFDVDGIWSLQNRELRNVWRLKIFGDDANKGDFVLDYRVIYAPDYQRRTIQVLGFMHRSINYEKDRKFVEEIKRRYDQLGLTRLPRA